MGEGGARNTAIALSLAVHGAMFWAYGDRFWQRADPAMASRPIVARISLAAPQPVASQLQASMPSELQAESPKPKVAPQPKPRQKPPQPSQVVKAEPVTEAVAEAVQPEPDTADVAEAVESTEPQQETPAVEVAGSEPVLTAVDEEEDEERSAAELSHYLAVLQTAIARHKEYPAMARRRGIEGRVEVSFLLLADGNARDIRISGGPKPLRRAAHQAVHRALRFPPPPAGTPTPLPVQYAMNFSLR